MSDDVNLYAGMTLRGDAGGPTLYYYNTDGQTLLAYDEYSDATIVPAASLRTYQSLVDAGLANALEDDEEFVGWLTTPGDFSSLITSVISLTTNTNVYAGIQRTQTSSTYTLSYYVPSSLYPGSSGDWVLYEGPTSYAAGSEVDQLASLAIDGFLGWYDDPQSWQNEVTAPLTMTENVSLYARMQGTSTGSSVPVLYYHNADGTVEYAHYGNLYPAGVTTYQRSIVTKDYQYFVDAGKAEPLADDEEFVGWLTTPGDFSTLLEYDTIVYLSGDFHVYAGIRKIETKTLTYYIPVSEQSSITGGNLLLAGTTATYIQYDQKTYPINTVVSNTDLLNYIPSDSNSSFVGWYFDEDLTNPVGISDVTMSDDVSLYAGMTLRGNAGGPTLYYYSADGQTELARDELSNGTVMPAENLRTYQNLVDAGLADALADDEEFVGWLRTPGDFSTLITGAIPLFANTTIYAGIQKIQTATYTLSYYVPSGIVGGVGDYTLVWEQTYPEGTQISDLMEFAYSGYRFLGWYYDPDVWSQRASTPIVMTENVALYAGTIPYGSMDPSTANVVILYYCDPNGNVISTKLYTAGDTVHVTDLEEYSQNAIPAGYEFAGWLTRQGDLLSAITGDFTLNHDMYIYAGLRISQTNNPTDTPTDTPNSDNPEAVVLNPENLSEDTPAATLETPSVDTSGETSSDTGGTSNDAGGTSNDAGGTSNDTGGTSNDTGGTLGDINATVTSNEILQTTSPVVNTRDEAPVLPLIGVIIVSVFAMIVEEAVHNGTRKNKKEQDKS
jgi:hypothetical protein